MIRNHRKIEAAQRERIRQIQLFSDKLQEAREEEQKRLARELHDELGGLLTSMKYDLLWLEKHTKGDNGVRERFEIIRNVIDSMTKVVQRISSELRPKILDTIGLLAAVEWQVNEFKKRTGINAHFSCTEQDENISINDTIKTAVYRIIQECLTNVARHSQAKNVIVEIKSEGNNLHVEVRDDGKGFESSLLDHPESLGLLSIRERARMAGGNATIEGCPGKGTKVILDIPLRKENELVKQTVS